MATTQYNIPERLLKLVADDDIACGHALVVTISEWEFQYIAKHAFAYLNRELTDVELNRIAHVMAWENKEIAQLLLRAMRLAIADALTNLDNRWSETDQKFLEQENRNLRPPEE